ncbi:cupredoxin domain-containing protein [Chloroflexi bacterium]|nr:cupredoxin domain-containing protein [Chloroflexota bacterium]
MIRRLVGSVLIVGLLFGAYACGDNVPPKGSHDKVKPAPINSTSSSPTSSAVVVAPPPSATSSQSSSDTSSAASVSSDYSLDIAMNDANANYLFNPADITVKAGETVTLNLTSENEFHSFTVDDLGIDVEVDAGTTEKITFTFSEVGTFDLICIPHESLGMVGKIIVQ